MDLGIWKYFLIAIFALSLFGCQQSKYVTEGDYLLSENNSYYSAYNDTSSVNWLKQLDKRELENLIRPQRNSGFRLFIYNRIDSARYQRQVARKTEKFRKKNKRRKAQEDKKNKKRIDRAKKKGKTHYKKKAKNPKAPRLGWRNWVVSHWAESPILLDTSKVSKSKQQMKIYLSQRGFKYGRIQDSISYNERKKKAEVSYCIQPGRPYVINAITFDPAGRNINLKKEYEWMVKKEGRDIEVGNLLDEGKLDDEREHFTKFLKDNAYFGFTKNYISFVVDTTLGDYKADIIIYIKEKIIKDPYNLDTTRRIDHFTYLVNDVTYRMHNPDSLSFKDWGAYKRRCKSLGYSYPYKEEGKYLLLDTIFVQDTVFNKHFLTFDSKKRKERNVKMFEMYLDTIVNYKGYFIYNEVPYLQPKILDKQNFLEHSDQEKGELHYAKDYYIDRTFRSFLRLDLFSRITPTLEIKADEPLGRLIDVTYDLTPAPKQKFSIKPRATITSSIFGISGTLSYTNKNLVRAGNQLTFSIEGGFQSQPLVSGNRGDSSKVRLRGLNTFEIGPEIVYKIPRFLPMTKRMQEKVSKRSFPSTEISSLYNFQLRPEFRRHIAELSYKWSFSSPNQTQIFTIIPLRLDYVFLNKTPTFDSTLMATNDPFLINSYADFFSIGVFNIKHEYTNQKLVKTKRKFVKDHIISNVIELSASGLVVNSAYALADSDFITSFNEDSKELFNIPFAQYIKLENIFIFNQFLNKKHRIAYRLWSGVGFSYGNGISLPYTESFVGGGSNDIRAFAARQMAPGSTQTWKDSTATETQIGDMKLELNLEWRFNMGGQWNGAIFLDIGNIWKVKSDQQDDPGLFNFGRFYKQVAIAAGFGLRYDLSFLILRLDLAWAIHNPYLDAGNRWWLRSDSSDWEAAITEEQGTYDIRDWPFGPKLNMGIGYPF